MPYAQGLPFAPGSHTSYKAAQAAALTRATKSREYLMALLSPMTDHEAARGFGWPLSSVCSIRNGLVQAGLVERRAQIKTGPFGRECSTWGLTDAGVAAVTAMRGAQ